MTDYADIEGSIWLDGKMIPWRDAKVHFLTHGLQYAGTVFEGERAYGGRIFKLREHTDRLIEGARIMGYAIPFTAAQIDQACKDVLAANGLADGYLRPAAWRGSDKLGLSPAGASVHLAIAAWAWPSYFSPEQKMKGVRLTHSEWRRPAPDTAPVRAKASGLYQICTIAKQKAEEQGFDDALMLDYRGFLAEATGANLFLVIDGKLHTPIADCFLNGITRRTVIDLARAAGLEVVERHMDPSELALASEAFLTGTAAEITPIGEIGEHRYTPGAVCSLIIDAYHRVTHEG
ncbi:branched-chain amino acid aminotransferase [Sphingobium sp.]|uniref:branched-chain amino acid aminotransferase n=1 Tax=Sphingobium sp. TaxID=1912891 RepID=UPI002C57E033|nr:branched-chain amino acid aminotransferase [Sphingobium sp.]HUD90290.1 branched-chain amino acid aminotransferase [Sphingobium sp.]